MKRTHGARTEQIELMEGQAREAMAASMAASMAVAEGGMSASEVASMRAKTRWQKLRVMDSKASGYLEASAVRGLQAMLSGENVDGAIEAANLVTPRTRKKKKKKKDGATGDSSGSRPGSRGSAASTGWSRPSRRGSSIYASTGFDSRPGSRGAGSRPNSRATEAARSLVPRSRPGTGKGRGGWRHVPGHHSRSLAIWWVADHRFDEAKARHQRLVRAVQQAGSDLWRKMHG